MIVKPVGYNKEYSVLAEPVLGVFASPQWLAIYGEELKVMGIYRDGSQLVGGFFYIEKKKFGCRYIKLPPYTPHCGLVLVNQSKNKASAAGFVKDCLSLLTEFLKKQRPFLTILAFPGHVVDLQPFIWSGYKVVPNYTYQVDLQQDIEKIRGNFDPKHRNAINKAISENVSCAEDLLNKDQLYDFFSLSLKGAGANVYEKELSGIFRTFADPANSFSFSAVKDGKVLGTVFCVYDSLSCYYLLGGVAKNSGVQGVNNLLVLRSMEKAKQLGCRIFDFEGSMLKGVEKFFRGFGGELIPYYTINKAVLPLELALKFKKRERF